MSNQLRHLLHFWYDRKVELEWVLATVVATEGSAYRKAGAMMLINSMGQYQGLLSGGCLEADIMRQARRCWDTGASRFIQYDMTEESDLSWKLGLGCGGMVRIFLQPIDASTGYLALPDLRAKLECQETCIYVQKLIEGPPENKLLSKGDGDEYLAKDSKTQQIFINGTPYLIQRINPPPQIAIFGGGVDSRPLVKMALELGWRIKLIDPRPANGRVEYFKGADIVKQSIPSLHSESWLNKLDAAIVMSHSIELDAQALTLVRGRTLKYLGMLGPEHRTERVLAKAGLERRDLPVWLANPIGLRLGGELPESIALSILAEVHAVLEHKDAASISQVIENALTQRNETVPIQIVSA